MWRRNLAKSGPRRPALESKRGRGEGKAVSRSGLISRAGAFGRCPPSHSVEASRRCRRRPRPCLSILLSHLSLLVLFRSRQHPCIHFLFRFHSRSSVTGPSIFSSRIYDIGGHTRLVLAHRRRRALLSLPLRLSSALHLRRSDLATLPKETLYGHSSPLFCGIFTDHLDICRLQN